MKIEQYRKTCNGTYFRVGKMCIRDSIMRVFSVVLLIMVGTVFAVGPAGLIVTLCKNGGMSGVVTTTLFWLIIILVYYFIATFISIDAIIGKIYPVFGICLIIMAVGVIIGIFTNPAYTIPELWSNFHSMHPSGTPIWSFMSVSYTHLDVYKRQVMSWK